MLIFKNIKVRNLEELTHLDLLLFLYTNNFNEITKNLYVLIVFDMLHSILMKEDNRFIFVFINLRILC